MNSLNSHEQFASVREKLQERVLEAGLKPLDSAALAKFDAYLELILRWNARTNLTGIRDVEGILRRHFVESIVCAQVLPVGIETLLDFGSGAGLPGIPVAICRTEIAVTLAESQSKKAAFLREVASTLKIGGSVFGSRAETLSKHFDCVTLRAVDRMEKAVAAAVTLVQPGGMLALMTTTTEFSKIVAEVPTLKWDEKGVLLPGSEQRVLRCGIKR